jgi:hypothetical protein
MKRIETEGRATTAQSRAEPRDAHGATGAIAQSRIENPIAGFLRRPPFALEIVLWLLLAGSIVAMRVYLWQLLPGYMWSRDAGSYAGAAFHWLDTGTMIFDGRRGPVYTLLIAAALKLFGTVNGVVWLQHGLGGLAIFAVVLTARVGWGRISVLPLFVCGVCLAAYGLPLHLGHLIRNESVLFILSAATLCSWWLSLKWNSKGWLFAAAVSVAVLTMTKNVFAPFPLVLVGGVFFFEGHVLREKCLRLALIVVGFLLPYATLKAHNAFARHVNPPEPQAGILFYGRTAQWTKLDGGIVPELKAKIRTQVEDYRSRDKLDNNIVIKRTIVPQLAWELGRQGKSAVELDRLCRNLALEAVENQPAAFWRQVRGDLYRLNIHEGVSDEFPNPDDIRDALRDVQHRDEFQKPHPTMAIEANVAALESHDNPDSFRLFHRLETRAILFQFYPVLLTTLGLIVLVLCTRGREREFFLGCAVVWYFNQVLLSTVGRPIDRYFMPLVPIIFWTLSGVIMVLWRVVLRSRGGSTESQLEKSSPQPASDAS